jgi:hypothetical protein
MLIYRNSLGKDLLLEVAILSACQDIYSSSWKLMFHRSVYKSRQ